MFRSTQCEKISVGSHLSDTQFIRVTPGPNIVTACGGFRRSRLNSKEKTTVSSDEEVTASCRARYT
jgi:hypothetical protein